MSTFNTISLTVLMVILIVDCCDVEWRQDFNPRDLEFDDLSQNFIIRLSDDRTDNAYETQLFFCDLLEEFYYLMRSSLFGFPRLYQAFHQEPIDQDSLDGLAMFLDCYYSEHEWSKGMMNLCKPIKVEHRLFGQLIEMQLSPDHQVMF